MTVRSIVKQTGIAFFCMMMMGSVSLLHAQSSLDQARIAYSNKEYLKAAELYKGVLKEEPDDEEILLEAGDVYMDLEFYDTARSLYQRAYEEDSRDGEINRKLGTALSLLGQHDEAIEKLRRSFKYDDESLDTRLALASGYLRMGTDSLDKAQIAILQADKEFENNPRVKVALGDLYFEQGVYQLAETNYKKAVELDNSLIEPRIRLGIAYREQGKRENDVEFYKKALEQFNYVTTVAPKEPVPWRQKGEIHYLARQYDQALNAYEQYIALRPDDPQGDFLFALAASEGQYFTLAIDPALRILSRDDERSQRFYPQARLLVAKGYYSKGQSYKDSNPDSAQIFYGMAADAYTKIPDSVLDANDYIYAGTSQMWKGDTAQGIAVWNSMIDHYPDSCALGFTLTRAIFSYNRYEDALASIDHLESVCGANTIPDLSRLRALTLEKLERQEDAIAVYNEAIKADSMNVNAYYRLLNLMASLKQYEEIPAVADGMIAAVPVSGNEEALASAYYFKGVSFFNLKEYENAIDAFEKAIELKDDHVQSYLYTAVSYHSLKDKDEACRFYQKVLQLDPGNEYATTNLKKLGC